MDRAAPRPKIEGAGPQSVAPRGGRGFCRASYPSERAKAFFIWQLEAKSTLSSRSSV